MRTLFLPDPRELLGRLPRPQPLDCMKSCTARVAGGLVTRACRTAVRHTPWVFMEHTYTFALFEQSPCDSTLLAYAADTYSLLGHRGVLFCSLNQRAQSFM